MFVKKETEIKRMLIKPFLRYTSPLSSHYLNMKKLCFTVNEQLPLRVGDHQREPLYPLELEEMESCVFPQVPLFLRELQHKQHPFQQPQVGALHFAEHGMLFLHRLDQTNFEEEVITYNHHPWKMILSLVICIVIGKLIQYF